MKVLEKRKEGLIRKLGKNENDREGGGEGRKGERMDDKYDDRIGLI